MCENIYYAIGDVHGEADRLKDLHDRIYDWHEGNYPKRPKVIIHLGDYIDRGPKSYEVLQYITALQNHPKCEVINLMGNHERLMLDACRGQDENAFKIWLDNGGKATMNSYKIHGFDTPVQRHIAWANELPSIHWDKKAGLIFVHAGIDPNRFPFENEDIRLWTRAKSFFNPACWQSQELTGMRVVHGHTPTKFGQPEISECGRRINIDTGACYGGALTAAIFVPGETEKEIKFLYT